MEDDLKGFRGHDESAYVSVPKTSVEVLRLLISLG
jgi:hypothetical protein